VATAAMVAAGIRRFEAARFYEINMLLQYCSIRRDYGLPTSIAGADRQSLFAPILTDTIF
jgi:hypothetical protein